MIVDKKQLIVSIDYVEQGDHYNCIIRLENGFEAIGRIHTKYRSTVSVSEEELKHMAHQYAIDYAEMHGYELDEPVKEEVEEPDPEEEVEEPDPEPEEE